MPILSDRRKEYTCIIGSSLSMSDSNGSGGFYDSLLGVSGRYTEPGKFNIQLLIKNKHGQKHIEQKKGQGWN